MTSDKKEHRIFIATPAFGHQTYVNYVNSVVGFISATIPDDLSYVTSFHIHAGSALISAARNDCVHKFLDSGCTKLLFIDADIGFEPENIWRLLRKDADIALAPYVTKSLKDPAESRFILHFEDPEKVEMDKQGFTKVDSGPAGFMMIDRSVFTKLAEAYPEKKSHLNQIQNGEQQELHNFYTFFDCVLDKEKGSLGEDISFCKLWRDMGGEIYCDAYAALTHYGVFSFQGQLAQSFQAAEPNK
jgi:glycosyltransferase involved in cell wall biosynthesis|tara:strand:+ start:1936 stop:2667 length:732 start_codon:yes stop_codon:yes gene_type:complete